MPKALITASVSSMIDQFCRQNIDVLEKLGYKVYVATNFSSGSPTSNEQILKFKDFLLSKNIVFYDIPFYRKIYSFDNVKSFIYLQKLIKKEKFDLIHTQSPVGGIITRLAAISTRQKGTKVIYTAHGFHFFKGSSILNWLLYFPAEWLCSFITDILVTINNEDYSLAILKLKSKKVINFPFGVGVDSKNFNIEVDRDNYLTDLNIPKDSLIIISIGELSVRKNHEVVIRALAHINNKKIYYIICGIGALENNLKALCKELNVSNNVIFSGFRSDRINILKISDIFVFPSLQEGLPVALMEAMSVGLPVVCSNVRGNVDLIENGNGGYIVDKHDNIGFANSINEILNNKELALSMSNYNLNRIKQYDKNVIENHLFDLYKNVES